MATDIKLDRQVAVKLLHESLVGDQHFAKRFRVEAQRVAQLAHQNIVTVYDWNDEGRPYIVTEYLAGGSLRGMLDAGNLLTPAQALVVGLGVTKGLEYAAKRGVVHRDIKPANLLFDHDGQVRIADFGLALALADAGLTQPDGEMSGTVQYASPEQAQGQILTEKSDIYSLAVTLVESVTGEVPFKADTPVGTLMARTESDLPVPEAMGRLQLTVARAGSLHPEARPEGGELKTLLLAAAESMSAPAKLPLVGANVPLVAPTEELAATKIGTPALVGGPDFDEPVAKKRKWPWVIFAMLVLGGAIAGGVFAFLNSQEVVHRVPKLVELTEEQALDRIAEFGWDVQQPALLDRSETVERGRIISTVPAEGELIAEGEPFSYTVSLGPPTVTVLGADLIGQPFEVVRDELAAKDLDVRVNRDEYDETVPLGSVISVEGIDGEIEQGSPVFVTTSKGPKPRIIPEGLVGQDVKDVEEILEGLRLSVVVTPFSNEEIPKGQVMGVNPAEGSEVLAFSEVAVWVSSGPRPRAVPLVIDSTVDEARVILEADGFCVEEIEGPADGVVVGQDPIAGEFAEFGSCVKLFTRAAEEEPPTTTDPPT